MKNNLRGKIRNFLTSEEGHVGVKSPLALGVASAGLLLAQAMVSPSAQAHWECNPEEPDACNSESLICKKWCHRWEDNTCVQYHAHCEKL